MKRIPLLVCLLAGAVFVVACSVLQPNNEVKTKFKVTGTVMQTTSYCGGARPTDEMLKSFATPRGIPFGKLFIKKASTNKDGAPIIDSISANENGNFSIHLTAGNYCLMEEWKTKALKFPVNDKNQTVDSACYRKLYNACDYELTITDKNIADLKIVFHRPCFFNKPCIAYKGPLPP